MTLGARLAGKTALVTGAARRGSIGRAIATALASEGADVAINDFGRGEEAEEIAASLRALGRRAIVLEADVTRTEACRRLIAEAIAGLGHLDILVNNAGFAQHKPFAEITEADFDLSTALHLKAPFFLTQLAAPHMKAQRFGRIVNISSEQAYIGYAELVHYTATKAGLRTLTKSLALALAPEITVNTVCPGPTATEKFKSGPEYRDELRQQIPLQRWVEPVDVGRSVVFLVSPDGDAFTGQTLDPNCGTVMP
jgi:NAD(P)-dependent dehydrogenase (short-subunit alcohol dehydrogenase family)